MTEESVFTPSITGTEMAVFKLDYTDQGISEVPDEKELSEIRSLNISKNQIQSLEFIEKTPNLIELDASNNQISDGVSVFSKLSYISSLNLASNLFENVSEFPILQTLTYLNLSNNHITSACDIPALPYLKTLDLSNNTINELNLASMPLLQVLNVEGNTLVKLSLPKLPSLRVLNVSKNQISTIDQYEEDDLPYLWSLDITHNNIETPDELKSLAKLPLLFDLKIEDNPMVKEDKSHIPPILVILQSLTELDNEVVNAKNKVKAELRVNGKKE